MPILTRAELEARLGAAEIAQLADRDAPAGEDAGVIDAALADAEAEVLGYVRVVTPAPIPSPAPEVLKRLVAVIARYNLWRREVAEDHPVYISYRDAVRELHDIAAGKISLPLADQSNAAKQSAGLAYSEARYFTRDELARMLP